MLVDHDLFKSVPMVERAGKLLYDTRGIWSGLTGVHEEAQSRQHSWRPILAAGR
jgi:hypothetical protein